MKPSAHIAIAAAVLVLLAACGKDDGKKSATQAAARVNKSEISVHQINQALARAGSIPPEQAKAAANQMLDKLIEQELFVQQAVEKKLDRDPKVMQAVEAARREILARAYAEQVMGNAAKPGADEIKSFYAGHPELFAERRVYNLQELAIKAGADRLAELQALLGKGKTLPEIVDWLKANNIPYAANAGIRTAEQLPLELLPKYHAIKDGQSALLIGPSGAIVAYVAGSQKVPLDETAATPFIEQFLQNRKRMELAAAELKSLKGKAKIEYQGEFGPPDAAPAAAQKPAAAAAPAAAQKPAAAGQHIDKGIAGLK